MPIDTLSASPLADELRQQIALDGPMPLDRFMALCLNHPQYGYYRRADPLGRAGDFITAPEISQMFGELIGLWCAGIWQAMGEPAPFRWVELGPGRGSLMADALRAGRTLPGFVAAAHVHLVETSPVLRQAQARVLADQNVQWHSAFEDVPDGPALIIANEFFDALPIQQFVRTAAGWRPRCIGLDPAGAQGAGGGVPLTLGLGPLALPPSALNDPDRRPAHKGDVLECCSEGRRYAGLLAQRVTRQGGAALVIDYGFDRPAYGDSLQAVRDHRPTDPLAMPGQVDLTAHVDFAALANAAVARGAQIHGPIGQGQFLRNLGIAARAKRLAARAEPGQAADIHAALERLTGDQQMGRLFRVLAFSQAGLAVEGFANQTGLDAPQ